MPCKSWFCVGHNAWSSPIFIVDLMLLFKCFPQVSSRLSNWSFYFSLIGEYFPYQEPMVSSCFAGIRARWCFSYLLLLLFCSVRELFRCAKLYNLVILFFFSFHFRYHFAFKPRLRTWLDCGLVRSQSHRTFDPSTLIGRTTGISSAVSVALLLPSHYITAIHSIVSFLKWWSTLYSSRKIRIKIVLLIFLYADACLVEGRCFALREPRSVDRIQS